MIITACKEFQEYGAICKLRGVPCAKVRRCYTKILKKSRTKVRYAKVK